MKALNLLESISKNIAVNNPELKPFADAFNEVIKANEKQLQDYKTWEHWGYEIQPNTYENQERAFQRSVNITVHASPAYPTA